MSQRQKLLLISVGLLVISIVLLFGAIINLYPPRSWAEWEAKRAETTQEKSVQEVAPGVVYVSCGAIGCPKALANFRERYRDELVHWKSAGTAIGVDRTTGLYFIRTFD